MVGCALSSFIKDLGECSQVLDDDLVGHCSKCSICKNIYIEKLEENKKIKKIILKIIKN